MTITTYDCLSCLFFIFVIFSNYSAHKQSLTLTRCNFTEKVTWFGWYTSFEYDDFISILMTSFWIFISEFLGSRLFILFVNNHKSWQLHKAHKSTKHATKMLEDNWPLTHQHFLVNFLQHDAYKTFLIFISIYK